MLTRWQRFKGWVRGRVLAAIGYEGATTGRRGESFKALPWGGADDAAIWDAKTLRDRARHMDRNHWAAKRTANVIAAKIVGTGILPNARESDEFNAYLQEVSKPQTQIGSQKGQSLATVQRLVARTVAVSGSCLVVRQRRTRRQMNDRDLVTPFQLAVLEPEFLDCTKDGEFNGNEVVQGIEYDKTGWPVAFHLYERDPNSVLMPHTLESVRVLAEDVAYVLWQERPGQTVGVTWFAPILLKLRDYDEYEDGQLMRQKVASMYAAFIENDFGDDEEEWDPDEELSLEPGIVQQLAPGEKMVFANPPSVDGYADFAAINLRASAAGVGLSYEDLSNDYSRVNFSSARMGAITNNMLLDQWQVEMMVGILCQSLDLWLEESAELLDIATAPITWTPPARALIDPMREINAIGRKIELGVSSRGAETRKLGRHVEDVDDERVKDVEREERLGLDSPDSGGDDPDAATNAIREAAEEVFRELRPQ